MMTAMSLIEQWWDEQTDDDKALMRAAVDDEATLSGLLLRTRCPFPFVGTAWAGQPMSTSVPGAVKAVIAGRAT